MQRRSLLRSLWPLAVMAGGGGLLAGCGGGGGDGAAGPSPAPAPNPGPAPAPLPGPPAGARTFAYIANNGSGDISVYEVADDGALVSAGAPVPARADIVSVAVHPSGRFAYGVGRGEVISSYTIDPETGLLTFVAELATGNSEPGPLLIHPSGQFAYQYNEDANSIAIYGIADSGALSVGTPFAIGARANEIALHPNGMFLFVTCHDRTIRSCSIDETGALSPRSSATTSTVGSRIAVAPSRSILLVDLGSDMSIHAVSDTGELGVASLVSAGGAIFVSVDPFDRFVYTISGGLDKIRCFAFNTAGALEPRTPMEVSRPGGFGQVAIGPSGRFLYAIGLSLDWVVPYEIEQTTGELTELSPVFATGGDPEGMAFARIAP